MSEIWKSVVGFEGLYSVSDQGRVRRDAGGIRNVKAGHVLCGAKKNTGYIQVTLYPGGQPIGRSFLVHRLVAAAFHGPCPENGVVNHKDGNPTNNFSSNLEYETHTGNLKHAREVLDKHQRGERCKTAKLNSIQVDEIRKSNATQKALAKRFAVSQRCIGRILHGETWSHATP